jgi:hypothetical protein
MKRSTLILLIVVLAAIAAIFLWERKRPGTDEAKLREGLILPGLPEAKEFTRLERSGEAPMVLEKSGQAWSLRSPLQDAADGYGVEGFLDRIRQAKSMRLLDAAVPWKDLGLEKSRATWTLKAGDKTFTLAVGTKAGLEEGLYLKVGDKAVLAPADLEAVLMKAPGEFRARDLVAPGSGRVVSFRITRAGFPTLAASRTGEAWTLREPFVDDADAARVEPLLDEVTFAQASSFVEPDSSKDFGMSAPRAEVALTTDQGKSITLKLGADAPGEALAEGSAQGAVKEERLFASVSGRPSILVVPAKILKALDVSPDTLRSTELFRHAPFDAEELRTEGAYPLAMKLDDKGAWIFIPPAKAPPGKDAGPVAEGLLGLRGISVEALGPGVPAPEAFVTVVLKGKGFEERVMVGPERDGKRYAYPKARAVALLLDNEVWRRAEASLKAVPLAPAKK